jgi:hypothetical protein
VYTARIYSISLKRAETFRLLKVNCVRLCVRAGRPYCVSQGAMPLLNVGSKPPRVKRRPHRLPCGRPPPLRPSFFPHFSCLVPRRERMGKLSQRGWSPVGKKPPQVDGVAGINPPKLTAHWGGLFARRGGKINSAPPLLNFLSGKMCAMALWLQKLTIHSGLNFLASMPLSVPCSFPENNFVLCRIYFRQ